MPEPHLGATDDLPVSARAAVAAGVVLAAGAGTRMRSATPKVLHPIGGRPMPFAVFFAPGGIAFHEGDVNSPSAGCVRLDRANAERWYATLQVGDRVEVHG